MFEESTRAAFIPRGYAAKPKTPTPKPKHVPKPNPKPSRRLPRRAVGRTTPSSLALVVPPLGQRVVVAFELDVTAYLASLGLDAVIAVAPNSEPEPEPEPWSYDPAIPASEHAPASPDQLYAALFTSPPRGEYWSLFLATFRAFLTPYALFHRLLLALHPANVAVSFAHAQTALDVLTFWVETQYNDFLAESRYMLNPLSRFASVHLPATSLDPSLLNATLAAAAHEADELSAQLAAREAAMAAIETELIAAHSDSLSPAVSDTDLRARPIPTAPDEPDDAEAVVVRKSRFGTLRRKRKEKDADADAVPPPPDIAPDLLFDIETGDVRALARQLALSEYASFTRIGTRELVGLAWSKGERDANAPNVTRLISEFNQLSRWVVTSIVTGAKVKVRALRIRRFIELAYECMLTPNYNAMMAVMAGLASSEVYRLAKTWQRVPDDKFAMYESIKLLITPQKNFRIMRNKLASVPTPCVPYLGMFLTDLTFAHDSVRPPAPDPAAPPSAPSRVYFSDWAVVGRIILALRRYQLVPFSQWDADPILLLFISRHLPVRTEEETYALSLVVEPRKS